MPRGFPDIESGSRLSKKLQAYAPTFVVALQGLRENGRVTPETPIMGKDILKKRWKGPLKRTSQVRAVVNHCCRNGIPIASVRGGYFFALSKGEIQPTLDHLLDRENSIRAHREGLEGAVK